MGNVAMALDDLQCRLTTIGRIQTQVLGATLWGCLAFDHDGRQNRIQLRHIMPVRSGHDERQGDATAVDQQVALASFFSPDPSDWLQSALAPVEP